MTPCSLDLILWLAVQALLIDCTPAIQYVMVINGLVLLGFAL